MRMEGSADGDGEASLGPGDGGHAEDYEFVEGDKDALGFVGVDRIKELKRAVREAWEIATSRAFARAQNPTARDVTPALGCDPEIKHHDFMDDEMEEDDSS